MRLIDADRLNEVLNINFGHTGGADVLRQLIDIQPTVQAVPIEVLQEIRQEIFRNYRVQLKTDKPDDWWVKWNECIDECLEIVDKHIKEIEGSDTE